jgi:hypothetical protein
MGLHRIRNSVTPQSESNTHVNTFYLLVATDVQKIKLFIQKGLLEFS